MLGSLREDTLVRVRLACLGCDPKNPHSGWILRIKSKIRISEIHDLSGFLGKDLTNVFLTGGFSRKEKRYETNVYRSRKCSFFGSSFFFLVVKNPYDLRSEIRFWILPKKRTHSKGLITPAGLAIPAAVTFIPVLHEKGQTGATIFI